MNRALHVVLAVLGAAVVSSACVPASEPAPPAGALGFALVPSAAARGEPFVTSDGWTVVIDKLVFQVSIEASPFVASPEQRFSNAGGTSRFDGSKPAVVFARAISVGPSTVDVSLTATYLGRGGPPADEKELVSLGVSSEVAARFRAAPDVSRSENTYDGSFFQGPSMLLAIHASRGDRVVSFDLTFDISGGYMPSKSPHDVVADALVAVPATTVAEALFTNDANELELDAFADADTNGDGTLTAAEILAATGCQPSCNQGVNLGQSTLLDTLEQRSAHLFVPQ